MPSSSKAQEDLMRAVAHNKAFANKVHIPQSVGMEFFKADEAKKKISPIEKRYGKPKKKT